MPSRLHSAARHCIYTTYCDHNNKKEEEEEEMIDRGYNL